MDQVSGWLRDSWGAVVHHYNHMTLGMALWLGFLMLTLVLMVLMSTRWGGVKPIWKCVILSVFAHILLGGYAYGTKLIFTSPRKPPSETISLRIVDSDTPSSDAKDSMSTQSQPWDELDLAPEIMPSLETVERLQPKVQQTTTRTQPEIVEQQTQPQVPVDVIGDVGSPTLVRESTDTVPRSNAHEMDRSVAAVESIRFNRQSQQETSPFAAPASPDSQQVNRVDALQDEKLKPIERSAPQPIADRTDDRKELLKQLANANQLTDQTEISDALADQINGVDTAKRDLKWGETQSQSVPAQLASAPRRLSDGAPMPEIYAGRSPEHRKEAASRFGGSPETEQAVDDALNWLASIQSADGSWNGAQFGSGQEQLVLGHDRKGAGANADTGLTGLSLLAFLAAGHSHLEGKHRETVKKGLEFLLRQQAADGEMAGNARLFARMYCHAMATLAITETLAMTGDQRMYGPVNKAVVYSLNSQHPTQGGWRYRPGDDGDMSQFGWQVLVIKSAELANIKIPARSKVLMRDFLRRCSAGQHGGLASYRPGAAPSVTMTAESLVCHYFLADDVSAATAQEASQYLLRQMPGSGKENLYYWYYGTLAMFHTGGPAWDNWNHQLTGTLVNSQVRSGDFAGSWAPNGVWAGYGGRVYSTAMATLCLEVYYRYQTQ